MPSQRFYALRALLHPGPASHFQTSSVLGVCLSKPFFSLRAVPISGALPSCGWLSLGIPYQTHLQSCRPWCFVSILPMSLLVDTAPCQSPHFRVFIPERVRIPDGNGLDCYQEPPTLRPFLLRVFSFRRGLSRSRPLSSFSGSAQAKLLDTPQRIIGGKITVLSRALSPFRGSSPFQ